MAAGEHPETGAARAPAEAEDRVRDAASVIAIRRDGPEPRILMGQRGRSAAFMPSKFVFPGGAVDATDAEVAEAFPPPAGLAAQLARRPGPGIGPEIGPMLALAAVRELWEETGLALAARAGAPGAEAAAQAPSWASFFAAGHRPACEGFDFVFRAVTPPGRPRRFDARFLTVDAALLAGDPEDFSGADQELAHLSWITLAEARRLDLPFITEVVLAELEARLAGPPRAPAPVPFFHHDGGQSFIDPL
ncbi:MAG: DNA mismatch repair protein MutT [Pseudomonadota bacterium]